MMYKFIICLLTFYCFIVPAQIPAYEYELSIAALFRDEAPFLKEWIEYHKLVGVEHFYLYNHLSQDNFAEVLAPYIAQGEVELFELTHEPILGSLWVREVQLPMHNEVVKLAKMKTKWLAVIDIDEFMVPTSDDSLTSILKNYDVQNVGGLGIPWIMFGTSNIEKISAPSLQTEMLLLNGGTIGKNLDEICVKGSYKSIVRPEFVHNTIIPSSFGYIRGKTERMLSTSEIQLNHYWTRDENYFLNEKVPRRVDYWGIKKEFVLNWPKDWNAYNQYSTPILKFIPALKEKMGY